MTTTATEGQAMIRKNDDVSPVTTIKHCGRCHYGVSSAAHTDGTVEHPAIVATVEPGTVQAADLKPGQLAYRHGDRSSDARTVERVTDEVRGSVFVVFAE